MARVIAQSLAISVVATSANIAFGGDPLVEDHGSVTVDWRRGAIVARAGAAADIRMPSANAARPIAVRQAQARARARLAEVLRGLPLGGRRHLDDAAVAQALSRSRMTDVEYQSNGGALVGIEIAFGDWLPDAHAEGGTGGVDATGNQPAPVSLWLPEGRLAAAPSLIVAGREVPLASVRYASSAALPTGMRPVQVRADKQGRLLVDGGANPRELAGRPAVIYVQRILR